MTYQSMVTDRGTLRLSPSVKKWIRKNAADPPANTIVYNWAGGYGDLEEKADPRVCPHCVAGHLIDVFDRYSKMFFPKED